MAFAVALMAGCATYRPLALPTAPDLAAAPAVTVPAGRLDLPGLEPHPIDPAGPWDETAVVTLAVLNNPDLKAARMQAGVADAQLLEAGLLPDPVVSVGLARSAEHRGYSLGLSEDIAALVTRSARRAAAAARARQVNLNILWQEWQVAAKAEDLFLQVVANRQLGAALTRGRDLGAALYRADEAALRRGEIAAPVVAGDLAALDAADAGVRRLQLARNQTGHALDALLGLEPGVVLRLGDPPAERALSPEEFQVAIAALPHRRADLLALQAGFESQEQSLRASILAQFPGVSAGVERARSAEEGVHTTGFSLSLTLPLFNRNRGRIAIERATREVLRQTYQARLDRAVADADQTWRATVIMADQLRGLDAHVAALRATAAAAEQSYREGSLNLRAYAALADRFQAAEADKIRLQSTLARSQAALRILLGLPFGG